MENNQFDLDTEELQRQNTAPQGRFMPVHCPRCKSRNVKFLTEYHKCLWLRFFSGLFLIAAVTLCFLGIAASLSTKKSSGTPAEYEFGALCAVASLVFYTIRLYRESKTHIQCVCPDCGAVWIHIW